MRASLVLFGALLKAPMVVKLTEYHLAHRGQVLPAVDESLLLDYVFAGNGTFVRGRRPGLEACIPVAEAPVRGLKYVNPYVQWGFPKVPASLLVLMFSLAQTLAKHEPREALFHLTFNDVNGHVEHAPPRGHVFCLDGWHLIFPPQHATAEHVELREQGTGSSEAEAVIEVHSHHHESAFFSDRDDEDEGAMSFRLYGVIGSIFVNPSIRVRVALFGHFLEYPASEFFEMPEGVTDLNG